MWVEDSQGLTQVTHWLWLSHRSHHAVLVVTVPSPVIGSVAVLLCYLAEVDRRGVPYYSRRSELAWLPESMVTVCGFYIAMVLCFARATVHARCCQRASRSLTAQAVDLVTCPWQSVTGAARQSALGGSV